MNVMSRWVWRCLPIVTVLVSVSFLPAGAGNKPSCDRNTLEQTIEQLQEDQQRENAQTSLQQCGEASAQPLARALRDDSAATRRYAAETLGKIGWEGKSVVPELIAVSQNDQPEVEKSAVLALTAILRDIEKSDLAQLQGWQTGEIQELLDLQKQLDGALKDLKPDEGKQGTTAEDLAALRRANGALQSQLRRLTGQPSYQVMLWLHNPLVAVPGLGLIVTGAIYFAILALFPLTLLRLSDKLIEQVAKIPLVGTWASLVLQVLSPFKYAPYVLDAWVAKHISNVRKNLLLRETIRSHAIHIPQSVWLQDKPVEFEPENFADLFKGQLRLVIHGEGGAGKTSLACQFAQWALWGVTGDKEPYRDDPAFVKQLCQHRMIPVWIEEALGEQSLLDAISARLKELTEADEISDELLKQLLQRRRVLVIVDHLSEIKDESTRNKIRPSKDKGYPVDALIVTSRESGILEEETTNRIQPSRITKETLADFLNKYLPEKLKREGINLVFQADDYSDAYKDLGEMLSLRQAAEKKAEHQSGATILLVTLYASQMIVEKQKRNKLGENYFTTKQNLASNVPDLMLNYLDILKDNSRDKDAAKAFPEEGLQPEQQKTKLHEIAQLVAWKCLENNYTPGPASINDVIEALTKVGSLSSELASPYLEYLKGLSLIQFQSENRSLRLSLDPLTEYLAALYKFWEYRNNQDSWMQFLNQIKQTVNPNEVRGFLLALYDCCDKKGRGEPIHLPEGVLKELVELAQLDQAKVDAYYRERRMRLALADLKELNSVYQLRAIADLATIAKDDQNLKESAIRCLNEVLEDDKRVAAVRREAGKALRNLKEPVPLLVPEICEGVEILHLLTQPAEHLINLSDDVTLELVEIPAGEFWMGSDDEEGSSDERPRHRVEVAGFWMGRYPVTQAQWQVVAGWEKIEVDLKLNPSSFEGGDRPVESISWYEAVEFCHRLSHHCSDQKISGRKMFFRLPSEAEWEHACRAKTETLYHFGETITEELANFRGNNVPNKTTPVGQYGVANRFGLYDMHGNVWEWCADHWHGDYEGAPTDGSAWLTENKEAQRLMRGGSWGGTPGYCRSAYRNFNDPDFRSDILGFRVVCVLA